VEKLRDKERICAALVMLTLIVCISYPVAHSSIAASVAGDTIGSPTACALEAQATITETRLTTVPADREFPEIYGDIIIWGDWRNGPSNPDIYMYNLSTGIESQVTTDPGDQRDAAIYGDIMVCEDWRNSEYYNPDIYMYDLSTGIETQVTRDPSPQSWPKIYGDIIVWVDERNGNCDIYMYNISTGTETQLTTDPASQDAPTIYGDIIVWTDRRNGEYYNPDIYMYNISTGTETPVTTDPAWQECSTICGDIIVWSDNRTGNFNIYMYNISTGVETRVSTAPADQWHSAVHGSFIVWTDDRNGRDNWDIYMYDLSTGVETQVTTAPARQGCPGIYGNIIVWEDNRHGTWDIYMGEISFAPEPIPPAEQAEDIAGTIAEIPGVDFAGATEGVQENRRHALLNMLQVVITDIQTAEASSDPTVINSAYQNAIVQLNAILDKIDGCAERGTPDTIGSGYTPDWITSCESQALIDPLIRILIASLEALLVT